MKPTEDIWKFAVNTYNSYIANCADPVKAAEEDLFGECIEVLIEHLRYEKKQHLGLLYAHKTMVDLLEKIKGKPIEEVLKDE